MVLSEVKRVLKPDGIFIFDVVDPECEMADNWAILETYLGTEVYLDPVDDWKALIKAASGKVMKAETSELFI